MFVLFSVLEQHVAWKWKQTRIKITFPLYAYWRNSMKKWREIHSYFIELFVKWFFKNAKLS